MTIPPSTVFLDANVPIYADGAPHRYKQPCVRILGLIAEGLVPAVTSAEVLQEVLNHLIRSGRRERGAPFLERLSSLVFAVLPVTGPDVLGAAQLALSYPRLTARDLVHLSVMRSHNIAAILSVDDHFDGVEGIMRLDPEHV